MNKEFSKLSNIQSIERKFRNRVKRFVIFWYPPPFLPDYKIYLKKRFRILKILRIVALGALAHRLQNPKWPPVDTKMADGVWKGAYP